jgi:hypothetical protein
MALLPTIMNLMKKRLSASGALSAQPDTAGAGVSLQPDNALAQGGALDPAAAAAAEQKKRMKAQSQLGGMASAALTRGLL